MNLVELYMYKLRTSWSKVRAIGIQLRTPVNKICCRGFNML